MSLIVRSWLCILALAAATPVLAASDPGAICNPVRTDWNKSKASKSSRQIKASVQQVMAVGKICKNLKGEVDGYFAAQRDREHELERQRELEKRRKEKFRNQRPIVIDTMTGLTPTVKTAPTSAMSVQEAATFLEQAQGAAALGNQVEARRLFGMSCDGGNIEGCQAYGNYALGATGGPKDLAVITYAFGKVCLDSTPKTNACSYAGATAAQATPPDFGAARRYLERGCILKIDNSCTWLALMPSVQSFSDNAPIHLRERANGAFALGNFTEARRLYSLGCASSDLTSCASLADMASTGSGGLKDAQAAALNYGKACRAPKPVDAHCAAAGYAATMASPANFTLAREYFDRGCKNDGLDSCGWLATMLETNSGGKSNIAEALRLYRKACDGKKPWTCFKLAKLLDAGDAAQSSEAFQRYKSNCMDPSGFAESCITAAKMVTNGRGVAKNPSESAPYLKRACELGDKPSCEAANRK